MVTPNRTEVDLHRLLLQHHDEVCGKILENRVAFEKQFEILTRRLEEQRSHSNGNACLPGNTAPLKSAPQAAASSTHVEASKLPVRPETVQSVQTIMRLASRELDGLPHSVAKRRELVSDVRLGARFDIFVGGMICANCIALFLQLQYSGYEGATALGIQHDWDWRTAKHEFELVERAFNIFFLLELAFRLVILRIHFFREHPVTNLVDAFVVIVSAVDSFFDLLTTNLSFLRILRIFRLSRSLKVVRVLTEFRQLRVLVRTIIDSFLSFVWSATLLMMCIFTSTLLTTQILQQNIQDASLDDDLRMWLFSRYGTSSRAFYTMFEATYSGAWPSHSRRLVEEVHPAWAVFWMGYAAIVVFAIIRIITAMFLKDTLAAAAADPDMQIEDIKQKRASLYQKLEDLMLQMDTSGDGTVSFDEFVQLLSNARVRAYFRMLEINLLNPSGLWELLDGGASLGEDSGRGDGKLTRDEFINGVMRIKGTAREQDLIHLMNECHAIRANTVAATQVSQQTASELKIFLSQQPQAAVW